ncbi:MAG: hypothetical protein LIP01_00630 [Tannerellaceae bacterium]|nr:hypothetical protein [Tannerellaceae bacterium]
MQNRIKICLLFIWMSFIGVAQTDEFDWLEPHPIRLFYKINKKEVPLILNGKTDEQSMHAFLHTPVEFPKENGQYLLATIQKNKVTYEHRQIIPYHIHHFKEYGTLCFQIIDQKGIIREDAKVEIFTSDHTPVSFDKKTLTCRINGKKSLPGRLSGLVSMDTMPGFR